MSADFQPRKLRIQAKEDSGDGRHKLRHEGNEEHEGEAVESGRGAKAFSAGWRLARYAASGAGQRDGPAGE